MTIYGSTITINMYDRMHTICMNLIMFAQQTQ